MGAIARILLQNGLTRRRERKLEANPNANVESFHTHEEPEFFDIESFRTANDFWAKITTYKNYWNLARPNSYKDNLTPLETLRQADPRLPACILLLPPGNLDILAESQVGHDVPVLPASGRFSTPHIILAAQVSCNKRWH